ncbi:MULTISPECIES: RiPP maturation radical SAM C-methyltransferase [unclassified Streptomyces]|uniref:RiPP maturation radical SAM C-methyltransferase n=1 Tax=unclassified Streptomyces TaxID=2593676 RepID=UPI001BEB49D3|nr:MULTISPECIES: RiPP maturation radical SAM C-methyltransferase [unclassified Streptomyces]MBT2407840.1 RiPP maturation radical SAM C-methyltransferase [Streptomyces sp. ISL-21]MBT2608470.1 RiPP maturation radical SAM C-methyltransferase [Streptomyces sp. ISL-87]
MKILMIAMPWQGLDTPSSALGILGPCVRKQAAGWTVDELYANLRWAECLMRESNGSITPEDYGNTADQVFHGVGDWVFTPALYDVDTYQADEYAEFLEARDVDPALPVEMQKYSRGFVRDLAAEIAADPPDVVGFTTTFMQNVPSLALARELKKLVPGILTVLGGSNCDGAQGPALHRNFEQLDFVVSGEGERALPALLNRIAKGESVADVPGLSWRDGDGQTVVNDPAKGALPFAMVPAPDYDSYFQALAKSPIRHHVRPMAVLETSRGCWWGEAHQCTFCGLNGSNIDFRSKAPGRIAQEVKDLAERYHVLDLVMVDNILDMKYLNTAMPEIAALDCDLRIHYEIKSNMTKGQLSRLKEANVLYVQPGIESLSSHVLRLMDKGVSGAHNVRMLRDGQDLGLNVTWNILYGFPGETADDYRRMLKKFAAIEHLQPPTGAWRIALERFSPHFEDPTQGFMFRRPSEIYDYIYKVPRNELYDLVFFFDTSVQGISGTIEDELKQAAEEWTKAYPKSLLSYWTDDRGRVTLEDRRASWPEEEIELDEVQSNVYLGMFQCAAREGIRRRLAESGHVVGDEQLEEMLRYFVDRGLVFEEEGRYVSVALEVDPYRRKLVGGKEVAASL